MRPSGFTGVQTHTHMLREGIRAAGFSCLAVTPFSGSKKWLPVFALRPALLRYLNRNWATRWHHHWHYIAIRENLRKHLAKHEAAAVVAQDPLSALAALSVRDQLRLHYRVATVCHFNVSQAHELREQGELNDGRALKRIWDLEQTAIETADLVVYNSHWQKRVMEDERSLWPRSSIVIWNGIGEPRSDGAITRADIGFDPDDIVLINVGTLEARKNQLGLLDLFVRLSEVHPNVRLLLVGATGPHLEPIRRKIKYLGLASKVRLLVDRSDVPSLLRLADVYVHYAKVESFCIALIEAAREGLPLAAVPNGGVTEVQSALGGGVSLDANDLDASVHALEPLLGDQNRRSEMGRRAQAGFKNFFTRDRMARAYLMALGLLREAE
jgi:glycosyltransferase involved in cell wall biosynthesis